MSDLSQEERHAIAREIEDLTVRYTVLVDEGRAGEVVELFTDDAVWAAPGIEMTGRDEIRAGFETRARMTQRVSRHVCTNHHLTSITADAAAGTVYLTLFSHDLADGARRPAPTTTPTLVGNYHDRFVNTDDGWRFAERRLRVDFAQEA